MSDEEKQQIREQKARNADELLEALTVEQVARMCHETNRAWCKIIGDDSHVPWDAAPEWRRESAIEGVTRLCMLGGGDPQASHDLWLAKKLRDGWRYGEEKNVEEKIHPSCLPFHELPKREQAKDHLFIAVIKSLVGTCGVKQPQRLVQPPGQIAKA